MPPLEEPSVSEMVRALGSQITNVSSVLNRVESALVTYVTQEQRQADLELAKLRDDQQTEQIRELKEAQASRARIAVSSLLAPVIVAVLVWVLTKGSA